MASDQKNAFIAVALSAAILFGWQYYFSPKSNSTVAPELVASTPNEQQPSESLQATTLTESSSATQEIKLSQSSGPKISMTNSLDVTFFSNPQARFLFADIVSSPRPFQIEFAGIDNTFKPVVFSTKTQSESMWTGHNSALGITAEAALSPEGMTKIKLISANPFRFRLKFLSEAKKLENGQERFFSFYDDGLRHWKVGEDEKKDATISWAGVDFNYHLFAVAFDHPESVLLKSAATGEFVFGPQESVKELSFDLVFLKKEHKYLASLGKNLKQAVDFGVWGFFAEWILKGLLFFYSLIPNYGVAIILLTFVVRLITFPLQYKSFVSMKRMQVIQPELAKIREKYKEDPMRLQKESMELFKRAGANPLGGCLPMLLQLPVFFAFYKVLYSAVELVDAPFVAWLHDLSNKDPYYVLPLLVTGAMFLQQKFSPTTVADPVQKKIFMFMPLIFGFIMKDLPSGLSLYIFVSTMLGICQQMLVFKMSSDKPVVV